MTLKDMTVEDLCLKCLKWTAIVIGLFFAFALVPPILVLALSLVPLLAMVGLVLVLFGHGEAVDDFTRKIKDMFKPKS